MKLLNSTYGKGRVRVMRLSGEGQNREVRELTVLAMLAGDIAQAYTQADNSTTVSTDTIKNVVNVVAREELEAGPEAFCRAVAKRLLNSYPGMTSATVSAREVRWNRLMVDGTPHPHAFTLDGNGQGTAEVVMDRDGDRVISSPSSKRPRRVGQTTSRTGIRRFLKRRTAFWPPAWRRPGAGRGTPPTLRPPMPACSTRSCASSR
jgi:urate oxidase